MRFRATLESSGKTAAGIRVPDEVVEALGSSRHPPVRVTIRGHTYRSSVASMGGRFMVGVSAENRRLAGVSPGEELDVDLELDTEPREVAVPADLAAALQADADASRTFESLSYSNRRRLVMAIDDARTDETRQRRIAKTVGTLHDGRS